MIEKNVSPEALCPEHQLLDELRELTTNNKQELVTIGNYSVAFTYTEEKHADYIGRVFAGSEIKSPELGDNNLAVIDTIHDPAGIIKQKLQPLVTELIDAYGKQEPGVIITPNCEIYDAGFYLVVIDRRNPETRVYNVGAMTHFALSSLIRKVLITRYHKDYPNLVPFHAASIVDGSARALVFSSYGGLGGGNKGKTTISLASVIRPNSAFSFLSNDQMLLSSGTTNDLHYHHLPSEINIKEGTLRGIQEAGLDLFLEEHRDINPEGSSYHLTAGGLENSGFSVASSFSSIKTWVNVDIKPGGNDYKIMDIDEPTQLALFIESINRGRLYHFYLPDVCGELLVPREYLTEENSAEVVEQAKIIYYQLKASGVRFVTIKGGVDRDKLYQLTKQLYS